MNIIEYSQKLKDVADDVSHLNMTSEFLRVDFSEAIRNKTDFAGDELLNLYKRWNGYKAEIYDALCTTERLLSLTELLLLSKGV